MFAKGGWEVGVVLNATNATHRGVFCVFLQTMDGERGYLTNGRVLLRETCESFLPARGRASRAHQSTTKAKKNKLDVATQK